MRITVNTTYDKQTTYLMLVLNLQGAQLTNELLVLRKLMDNRKGDEATFSSTERKEMMDSMGITKQQLTNILRSLQDKKLIDGERGHYKLSASLTNSYSSISL